MPLLVQKAYKRINYYQHNFFMNTKLFLFGLIGALTLTSCDKGSEPLGQDLLIENYVAPSTMSATNNDVTDDGFLIADAGTLAIAADFYVGEQKFSIGDSIELPAGDYEVLYSATSYKAQETNNQLVISNIILANVRGTINVTLEAGEDTNLLSNNSPILPALYAASQD